MLKKKEKSQFLQKLMLEEKISSERAIEEMKKIFKEKFIAFHNRFDIHEIIE